MASLQTSNLLLSSQSPSCYSSNRINAAISLPKLPKIRFSPPKKHSGDNFVEELKIRGDGFTKYSIPIEKVVPSKIMQEQNTVDSSSSTSIATIQLYAILEAVADRVEMHKNVGEQRDNWNTHLLNSINMITLTAATMTGLLAATGCAGGSLLALKLSATLLFSAATGMLVIMNKIQPSQLAEEQRNATKLFKQLQREIQTVLAFRVPSEEDVKEAMQKVLALDKAYPLPLIGKMIEKFPKTFEPAVWWPSNQSRRRNNTKQSSSKMENNGWTEELEMDMREIVEVLKSKDTEDYVRLGNLGLKINKTLAISGPLLTGIAAVGSAFSSHGSWAAVVAVAAGALASTVNTLEHGGQVGMVLEMYRNCAGFFTLIEESIESTLNENEVEKRENGEMFETKVGLQLGRSVSELRELARKSNSSPAYGSQMEEFVSKLF
ncbi:F-box protein [Melia azedarach]|uniref:F-box protein n=2 Tax=Melia azedarach TaxID=155640 RepID=A0ACC1WY57_MELAZ|nr:F-box protein [Melia azedarach]KAJ4703937.1 F-box protein [Melia azedarach]